MSDAPKSLPRRDAGMTLPELLISMVVIGLILAVVAGSMVVTLRTQRSTDGRLNVARSEQGVSMWLPTDLASAVTANDEPGSPLCAAPCPTAASLGGSNALVLSWPSGSATTTVAYLYRPQSSGQGFELLRVECTGGTCQSLVVLHDLAAPSGVFVPGVTPVPDDVINVTIPLAADATSEGGATDSSSGARRIIVTINGGGASEGDGGGVNRVSITAGGTDLGTLEAEKVTGPSFLKAQSRCGGPITIIVDDSGSIAAAGAATKVEEGVRSFVKALAGTPTKVQIIAFSNESRQLDSPTVTAWNHYYEMTNLTTVSALVGEDDGVPAGTIRQRLGQTGGTNWEDAIYRTFYSDTMLGTRLDADGNPATYVPNLVVFFTDGEPTRNMEGGSSYRSTSGIPSGPIQRAQPKWPTPNGSAFDQEGYDRADFWINDFRNSEDYRIVGVGVGSIANSNTKVYAFNDATAQSYSYGLTYSSSNVYRRSSGGGTSGSAFARNTTTEKVLGNFVVGGALLTGGTPYVKASYDDATDKWTNTAAADLFVTEDWDALAAALTEIAVGKCGGTLTLQTRMMDGSNAPSDVSYETQGKIVTTSAITRAASFEFDFPAGTGYSTPVVPQDFATTGYTAESWACTLRGLPLSAARWSLIVPTNRAAGINVQVEPNEAVSCTLTVSPS
jgi:prepilin-type N-terminal cleavage/methylation domain-containing protein